MIGATTIVHNPYAKKKPLLNVLREPPLYGAAAAVATSEVLSLQSAFPAGRKETEIQSESSESLASRATLTASSSDPVQEPSERSLDNQTATMGNSINTPLWQRLPSETISFGSAEILTVPEICHRFRNRSVEGQYNQSLRVTGVVLHRYVHPDASISLVLGDPLAPLSDRKRPTSVLKRPLAGSLGSTATNVPKTPGATSAVAPTKTPGTTTLAPNTTATTTTTTGKRPPSSILFNKKKAPVLVYKKQNTGRRLSFAAGLKQTPGGCLRRFPAQSPLDMLINAITGTCHCILIVVAANHPQAAQCAVNDLVMAMGEARRCSYGTSGPSNDDDNNTMVDPASRSSDCAAVAQVVEKLGQRNSTNGNISYLQARILRNANGTNMRLHTDALMARRSLLQQTNNAANGGP